MSEIILRVKRVVRRGERDSGRLWLFCSMCAEKNRRLLWNDWSDGVKGRRDLWKGGQNIGWMLHCLGWERGQIESPLLFSLDESNLSAHTLV